MQPPQLLDPVASTDFNLKLFLSVDIIGSTAFKAQQSKERTAGHAGDWTREMLNFFTGFPTTFKRQLEIAAGDLGWKRPLPKYKPWKNLGDELIFVAEIRERDELELLVIAFHAAVKTHSVWMRIRSPMRVKGTAWIANFPYPNREVAFPDSGDDDDTRSVSRGDDKKTPSVSRIDYFGPDIDIGFRIARAARDQVLLISMPLADLLEPALRSKRVSIYHVGWEVLKGVFDGKPYPIFWLHTRKRPRFLSWEGFLDERTQRYTQEKQLSALALRKLIDEVRHEVGYHHHFAPVFREQDLPPEAKVAVAEIRKGPPDIPDVPI